MEKFISYVALTLSVLAIVAALVGGNGQPSQVSETSLGQAGTRFPHGLSVGDGLGSGCYQVYATSSATVGKFVASSTSLVNGVSTGVVLFQYGGCL